MVDFKKKLNKNTVDRKTNPVEIYDTLDRRSVTGPLRPTQKYILEDWFKDHKDNRDLIIKLHTGEGKTLIGLLMLQSKINSNQGPCIFICPNKYLVNQAIEDARKFGILVCEIGIDNILPDDFINGKRILITHVQKVFNGKSIFGIGTRSSNIGSIILDDAHACIDAIKDSFTVKIDRAHECYKKIFNLFDTSLCDQGMGTYLELYQPNNDSFLPIPYWEWIDKSDEVMEILSYYKEEQFIKFVWPLLKDHIDKCQAFVSGSYIEISSIHLPIEKFSFFTNANNRILMSATTQDDSFFIKGLNLSVEAVNSPLKDVDKIWSGEKMILIPSLIHDDITRDRVISLVSKPSENRKFGVVSLVSSFTKAQLYFNQGAINPNTKSLADEIKKLKNGNFDRSIVLANRYDGIDLPDESCRVLVIDGKPNFTSLSDKYEEQSRINSDYNNIKIAQKIEQGLGRSVRGEKDYSVILMIGADLVKFVKSIQTNKYFSYQTRKQIEIGLEIAKMANDEVDKYKDNRIKQLVDLINQTLHRDEDWKEYYTEEMNSIDTANEIKYNHKIYELEKKATKNYFIGDYSKAADTIQELIDSCVSDDLEKGWYLQLKAKYLYNFSKISSNELQKSAFNLNYELLKPKDGITYQKLSFINENRIQKIKEFILNHKSYSELALEVEDILSNLDFGISHEKFEKSIQQLGKLLGFLSERPDKEIKKGPDNLWCISVNQYLIFECKSEVDVDRIEIIKSEAGQMNNHCGWFEEQYGRDVVVKYAMIIPTKKLASNANFTHRVEVIRKGKLKALKSSVKNFIKEFKNYDLNNITSEKIHTFLEVHKLDNNSLTSEYSEMYTR
ncbi:MULTISPECIES: DEAD/DEAH box helicase family protein [Sphingobacterium]|uniref:DEAD/DEAH box helicase family protein n=1 Tax=Sphingobacterium TaxID=28453 RepID=UPI0010436007|nr:MULTISPECIES: DEAD/DEAH box helicase family protein [Sphingobacterium]MCW2258681.1 replicative superfamily II helicase [Sphingobacterium kitahiroshimense]TCR14863.1 replicative superfamily II helicase [Sphingobacterium sp. JUb78]